MAKTAIIFGIILTLLGLIAYFGISSESITALIPAFFGVPVIILGWLALNEKYRKHSMHIAAALMLLGFIGTGIRVFPQLFGEVANPSAFTVQLITQSLQLDSFWKAVCSAFLKPCNLCQPLQRLAGWPAWE